MIRNVIFDWSGTLVDDLPAVVEATNHVLGQAGLAPMTVEEFRREFRLPFTSFYESRVPQVPLAELERWFHRRFREVQDTVRELAHAREFLEFCREKGLRTLLLSTMHADHFPVQARVNGFDRYLDHLYLGVWDKREKIHEILRVHGLAPEETVFIGDMEHDVETARVGGIHSVAVLTGYNDSEALRRAGPTLLVRHLGELRDHLVRNGMELVPGHGGNGVGVRRPIVTVGAAVFDDAGRVLMVRTRKWSNRWGIPGGKVEWGEGVEAALRRELLEETGLEVDDIRWVLVQDCIGSTEFYRDEHFVLLNYRCVARPGQVVCLNDEAEVYRWVTLSEARGLELNQPTLRLLEALEVEEAGDARGMGRERLAGGEGAAGCEAWVTRGG